MVENKPKTKRKRDEKNGKQKRILQSRKKLIFLKDLRDINNEAIEILLDDLKNWKQLFREKIETKQITQAEYNILEKRVENEIAEKIERLENENYELMMRAKKINEELEK